VVLLRRQGSILNRASERLVQALITTASAAPGVSTAPRKKASGHQKA
jgi:hypothetical protein